MATRTPTSLTGSPLCSNSFSRSLTVSARTASLLVYPARDLSLVKVSKWWNLILMPATLKRNAPWLSLPASSCAASLASA